MPVRHRIFYSKPTLRGKRQVELLDEDFVAHKKLKDGDEISIQTRHQVFLTFVVKWIVHKGKRILFASQKEKG